MAINSLLHGVNNPSLKLEKELNTEFIIKDEILEENVALEHKLMKDEDVTKEVRIKNEIVDESFTIEHVQIKEEKLDEYIPIEPEPDLRYEQFSSINNRNIKIENVPTDQHIQTTETPFPHDTWNHVITNASYYQNKQKRIYRSYICNVCNKSFGKSGTLVKHLSRCRRKHKIPRVSCDICSKRFPDEVALSKHKRVHENIEPNPIYLNKQEKIHPGSKRYTCEVCNKLIGKARSFAKHLQRCRRKRKKLNKISCDCFININKVI